LKSEPKGEDVQEKSLKVLVFQLISDVEKLRKIDREIAITVSKTQIGYLMSSRRGMLKQIATLRAEIASRVTEPENVDFRLFQLICRVLNAYYGRGVGESILMTFERQSGLSVVEIVNYPTIFEKVVVGTFGEKASSKINAVLISEIGQEFGLDFPKNTLLNQAILTVMRKSSEPLAKPRKGALIRQ
jgi:hypothetical protein